MSKKQQLCIGFALIPSWFSGNGWRREDSGVETLLSIDFYIELAQKAEAAKLDFVFRPDSLFLIQALVARDPGFTSLDPFVLLGAVAQHTSKIGLIATASTTFLEPYQVARQLQSLQWISKGRAGWNIVTALEGQQNFGDKPMPPAETRYAQAQEFLDVVQQLWQSYPNEALAFDKETGCFADVEKIHPIDFKGDFFQVQGPLNTPATPYGPPALFQAGASATGRRFAAKVADAIFAATPDIQAGQDLCQNLSELAKEQGRPESSVKVLPGLSLYLAETKAEAEALFAATHANDDKQRRFNFIKAHLGIDLSQAEPEMKVTPDMVQELDHQVRSQTHRDLLIRFIAREPPTVAELMKRPEVIGSAHWLVIGTVEDAYQSIVERIEAKAAHGFIAIPAGSKDSLNLFFERLMPMLVENGWFRSDYSGNTLREHLALN